MNVAVYRKAIAALFATVGTWGVTAAEGGIDGPEWFGLLVALGGTGAVWGIANEPADDGQSVIAIVVAILLAVLILRLLGVL